MLLQLAVWPVHTLIPCSSDHYWVQTIFHVWLQPLPLVLYVTQSSEAFKVSLLDLSAGLFILLYLCVKGEGTIEAAADIWAELGLGLGIFQGVQWVLCRLWTSPTSIPKGLMAPVHATISGDSGSMGDYLIPALSFLPLITSRASEERDD